jgi:hypothetical protein
MVKTLALAVVAVLAPLAAQAQTASGPLVLERIHNPFVVAPDYKITNLDGETGQLAGGYVGKILGDALFVGGAGYWLVNGSGGDELAYGGLVAGWSMPAGARLRFGGRGLVGFGSGELGTDVAVTRGVSDGRRGGRSPVRITDPASRTVRFAVRDDFFVFEPQVDALARVTDHIGVHLAGGYRLTGATDALDDRVNGVTGSVALQLQW